MSINISILVRGVKGRGAVGVVISLCSSCSFILNIINK